MLSRTGFFRRLFRQFAPLTVYLIGRGRVNQNEGGSTKIENQPYSYSVYTLHCTVHTLLQESLLLPSYCIWLCICSVSELEANTWRINTHIYDTCDTLYHAGFETALFCFVLFCFSVRSATRRLPRFQGMKIHRFCLCIVYYCVLVWCIFIILGYPNG